MKLRAISVVAGLLLSGCATTRVSPSAGQFHSSDDGDFLNELSSRFAMQPLGVVRECNSVGVNPLGEQIVEVELELPEIHQCNGAAYVRRDGAPPMRNRTLPLATLWGL